jgi:polar amino acid transport system substrate-binding protein
MNRRTIIGIVAVIVLVVIGYFFFKPAPEAPTEQQAATEQAPAPAPAEPAQEATAPAPAATQEAAKVPDVVRMGVAAEPYPPYSSKDATGTWVGWEIDLYKAVCESVALKCELVEVAWDGIIPALQEKKIDVIWSSMTINDKRKEVIDFTQFYYDSPTIIIGNKSDATKIDFANADSVKGKIFGVQTATIHADYVQKYFGSAAEVKLYDTLDNALADLKAGRLDYVQEGRTSLAPFLSANADFAELVVCPQDPLLGYGVGGGVRKEDTALRDKLSEGIKQVVQSGKYDEITKKYPELEGQLVKPTF